MGNSPRHKLTAEQVAADADLTGKTVLITGANTGLGLHTARVLASRGAHVVMAARDKTKLDTAIQKVRQHTATAQVTPLPLDLSSLAAVHKAAEHYKTLNLPLHILILNAGIMAVAYELTADGIERHMATNHVAHFHFTQCLMPLLLASATVTSPARVIAVSSEAHKMHPSIDYARLPDPTAKHYSAWKAYGQSKYANILYANELNRRYASEGVTAYSLHPGIIATSLYDNGAGFTGAALKVLSYPWSKNVPQGAATSVYVAVSDDVRGGGEGQYYNDSTVVPAVVAGLKEGEAERFWEWTEELIKSKTS